MAYVNIHSLYKYIDDVLHLLKASNLDILIVGETFLNYSVGDCMLKVDNYRLVRFDRDLGSGKRVGGGLAAYIGSQYNVEYIEN